MGLCLWARATPRPGGSCLQGGAGILAQTVAHTLLAADLLTTDRTLLAEGHGVRWAG